jgi:hypothetical protein
MEQSAQERRKKRRNDRRQARFNEELQKLKEQGISDMTQADIDILVLETYHTKGKVPEFPHLTLEECIVQKKIVAYVGLLQWEDRKSVEPFRFLADTKEDNNAVIVWQPDPSTPPSKITYDEADNLLGFKPIWVYNKAAPDGLEAYMVERAHIKYQAHSTLGKQRLNRVSGCGRQFRGKDGNYHVFVTYAITEHLKQFSALTIVKNKQKIESE